MPARTDQQQTGAHSGGALRRQLLRGLSPRQPGHFSALANAVCGRPGRVAANRRPARARFRPPPIGHMALFSPLLPG